MISRRCRKRYSN